MTARVSCVGVAVLDLIYGVERLPSDDGKIVAHSLVESGGGMAANAAATIARLGGRAAWFGRVGDDEMGVHTLAGLETEGVDIGHIRRIVGVRTSHSIVLVDQNGDRAIVLFGADALEPDASWLPTDEVLQSKVVLADIRWTDGAIRALTAARKAGLPAVLDAENSTSPNAINAVCAASHAIFSRPGLSGLFRADDPEEGLRRAAKHSPFVAVTLGAEGVLWLNESGRLERLAAVPIVARETLGAGDVFHGAFALALAEGRDNANALRFATAAAAVKCGRTGGRASFPNRAEVELRLSQMS
jgi:sulfofructose kinase